MGNNLYLAFQLLLTVALASGAHRIVYFNASGIIVNHNYTAEFLEHKCRPCRDLISDIDAGVENMLDFFERFNVYQSYEAENTNRSIEGVFFRSPSNAGPDYGISLEERKKTHVPESGLFFILVLRLDFELPNPENDWSALKDKFINCVWAYLRGVKDFQLHRNVLLNGTAFEFMEVPEDVIDDYLTMLRNEIKPFTPRDIANPEFQLPTIHRHIMRVISYVGCSLSMFGLLVTLLTIIMFRKIRRMQANQILAHLCVAYLGAIATFLLETASVAMSESMELCRGMAALMHYFLLSAVTWMSIEACNSYQDLVKVFDASHPSQNKFMCRAAVVGWAVPGVVVVLTLLLSENSYGFHTTDDENFMCWLEKDAFYGAFLAPITLLMVINLSVFIVAMRESYKVPQNHTEKTNRLGHFCATAAISFLLGLNWVFAGLAAADGHVVLQYLFTITCSFQGCTIFILYGIVKKDFREAWKRFPTINPVMQAVSTNKTTSASLSQQGQSNPACSYDVELRVQISVSQGT